MTPLAPKLFDRRYDDFRRLGLSLLPALAPGWTDYNAHDPGITLVELLAWVAEAQLYSVGRMRRDERVSYAALLGVAPGGRRPAHGLIWADRSDPASPAATFAGTRVIDVDAAVRLERHDEPVFHPERKTLWVPGRIVRLSSRRADGTVVDLTATNARGAPFLPFGDSAGPRDVLSLEFETGGDDGLFPALRAEANGATWAIGVRATAPAPADDADAASPPHDVAVALVAGSARFPLRVVADSTAGLLRTGRLVLDVSRVGGSPKRFRIELRVPRGFACPPQWSRIEPSVLEITERQTVDRELHFANDEPNVEVDLGRAGLSFEPRSEPLQCVEVRTETDILEWSRCDRLEDRGPDDRVYELDPVRGRLAFGNGVNGRKPGAGAEIYVTYAVCSGEEGNVSRGHRWTVVGFPGAFGVNPEPIAGGAERPAWSDLRRETRRRFAGDHPLVSREDLVDAALRLPLLDVARAWVVPASDAPRTGTVTLIALRVRRGPEPSEPPETARWLDAVRRRLAPRMPLGTRLVVARPRYVDVAVRADVEVEPGRNPDTVADAVESTLRQRFAPAGGAGFPARQPGVPVGRSEVAAWILGVEGVARLVALDLLQGAAATPEIRVPHGGLPRLSETSTIRVSRPGTEGNS
ncbi:MAG TPA: putative baseplate assembly protein [Candidatus Binatia bacterium]|nr:putative baseplate assembly protein [Candidatus Binatia bacterium]